MTSATMAAETHAHSLTNMRPLKPLPSFANDVARVGLNAGILCPAESDS
jgi:hypothetical protein